MSNVLAIPSIHTLSDKEKENFVRVSDWNVTEFTDENLGVYEKSRVGAINQYPDIYGSRRPDWLNYKESILVRACDIVVETANQQTPRMRDNDAYEGIKNRIIQRGFELFKIGIYVTPHETIPGKYRVVEGRTRLDILMREGMSNIIAEVFIDSSATETNYSISECNILRFGVYCNSAKDISGKALYNDWRGACVVLTKRYKLDFPFSNGQSPTDAERKRYISIMAEELAYLSNNAITKSQCDNIVNSLLAGWRGSPETLSFPDAVGIEDHLDLLVNDDDEPNRRNRLAKEGIYYVATTNDTAHMPRNITRYFDRLETKGLLITELRYVVYKGRLAIGDPSKDWELNVKAFKAASEDFNNKISERLFHGVKADYSVAKMWGAIPQVLSLEEKYPMDKIFVYPEHRDHDEKTKLND